MAGGKPSSSHHRNSHPQPNPTTNPIPNPQKPNPPPAYGFHMLDRRTILLADGSARSYLALPPDYQDFPPIHYRQQKHWNLDASRKRKFGGEERDDEFARQRQQLLQYGNGAAGPSNSIKVMRVDDAKVKSAFLNYVRVINENANQQKKYLADGKQGSFQCLACARSSKDYPDVHSLVMHTYSPTSDDDHLGLHKALCVLMGWNYLTPPDNSKVYQRLSAQQVTTERDDLIMWPPHVIIRNTCTGKGRDGRMEGLGNKAMEKKLREFGISSGKPKSMYGRDGHMGTTVVKFAGDVSGLKDAVRLAELFEKQKHGRGSWAAVQPLFKPGSDDEKFVKLDKKTGEKERVLYGYLGTAFDLEVLDFDTRKKVTIESKKEKANH